MKNSRLLVLILLLTAAVSMLSFFLTACGKNVKNNTLPPGVYYKKALNEAHNRNYTGAAKDFKNLIENYPAYRNTVKAELKLGDVYYLNGKYIEAQGAYSDFITLHPRSEYVSFAMFYEAMSFYKRKQAVGRTQSSLRQAKIVFEKLISNYPYSKHSKKAMEYIKKINIYLSENTFFTGLYYYNASMWKPAIYMFKIVLKQYPGLPVVPKTLHYLVICYKNVNDKKAENHYLRLLKEKYPHSKYAG